MIEIVSKTKDYVVIYKPAGIPSQSDPTGDADAMTLCSQMLSELGEDNNLFLIHRLDRTVGGLLVFARNKRSAASLSSQVADHSMTKEYFAILSGRPEGGVLCDYIYKDARLGKAFVTDKKRAGVKEAELEYSTLATAGDKDQQISLVKVRLKTGRFHQIRVQFASRKMPLIGDKKYGSRDIKARCPSLFATSLSFDVNGERLSFSKLPPLSDYPWSLFGEEMYK